jgi:hypothetical protein
MWSVFGTFVGFFGGVVSQWLATRGTRKQRRADVQAQSIRDLQDALAALLLRGGVYRFCLLHGSEGSKGSYQELREWTLKYLEETQSFSTARQKAEVYAARIENDKIRDMAKGLIRMTGDIVNNKDDDEYQKLNLAMISKFTEVNDRRGALLRAHTKSSPTP